MYTGFLYVRKIVIYKFIPLKKDIIIRHVISLFYTADCDSFEFTAS